MRITLTFLMVLVCIYVWGQSPFVKTLETGSTKHCSASCIDPSDDVYMVGDIWDSTVSGTVIKVDSSRMLEWAITINQAPYDLVWNTCVAVYNNTIYVGGNFDTTASLLAFDLNGQLLWYKHMGLPNSSEARVEKIIPGPSGLYVLCSGYAVSGLTPHLIKLDPQGNFIWAKKYAVGGYPLDMIYQSASFEFAMTIGDGLGTTIIWTDTNGIVARSCYYTDFIVEKLTVLNDSAIVAVGSSFGSPEIFAIQNNGTPIWAIQLLDTGGFVRVLSSIAVSADNFIYVGTNSYPTAIGPPCALLKISTNGNIIWSKGYFTDSWMENSIKGIHERGDLSLYLAGVRPLIDQEYFVMKEDTSAAVSCVSFPFLTTSSFYTPWYSPVTISASTVTVLLPVIQPVITPLSMNQYWDCQTDVQDNLAFPQRSASIYPNPSNGEINISGNFPPQTQLNIFNMLGQKIGESIVLPEGNNIISINLELEQGAYYYELRSPLEQVAEGRIIIAE